MINFRRKISPAVAALAVAGAGLGGLVNLTTTSAHADPAYATRSAIAVGVGSDTIQDVFDAFTGADPYPPASNSNFFTPLHATTNNAQIASFDAVPAGSNAPGCITTILGGPTFDRPNGSSKGIEALTDSLSASTPWQAAGSTCTTAPVNIQGQVDFARSSRGVKTAGTTLTFIPVARDAVSFAYWDHSTNVLSNLTSAQLKSLYSSASGTITVGTDTVKACLMQAGSGTRTFWENAIGVTDAQADAAATAAGCNGLEENGANQFYSSVSALPAGTDAIIPFSVGSWISQANGAALDRSATGRTGGVNLGGIDGSGTPYTGIAPNEAPLATFYASTTYGRDTYVVVPTAKLSGFTASAALKGLFVSTTTTTAAVCAADAGTTKQKYGFLEPTQACGSTTLTGNN